MKINSQNVIREVKIGEQNYLISGRCLVGSENEWAESYYTPGSGEIIVYNSEEGQRLKIGDGATSASDLPYATDLADGTADLSGKMDKFGSVTKVGDDITIISPLKVGVGSMLFQGYEGSTMGFRLIDAEGKTMAGLYIHDDGRVDLTGAGSNTVAITNLKAPTKDGDAVNKNYVDQAIEKILNGIDVNDGILSFGLTNN